MSLRRMRLAIGVGMLPMLLRDGRHHYNVANGIPDGTVIVGVSMDPNGWQVWLLLEHESFPETVEGGAFPEIEPTFTTIYTQPPVLLSVPKGVPNGR